MAKAQTSNNKDSSLIHRDQLDAEINGSNCPMCLQTLESKIAKIPGVIKVSVESPWDMRVPEEIRSRIQKDRAIIHVCFKDKDVSAQDLLSTIKDEGFQVHLIVNSPSPEIITNTKRKTPLSEKSDTKPISK